MTYNEFKQQFNISLTEQQEKAVLVTDGPVCITAVPGSGKSHTLLVHIAYLILCRNVDPRNILAVTYTKAAAAQMSDRFKAAFGTAMTRLPEFRTINGICAKVILSYSRSTGKRPFELISEQEQHKLLTDLFREITKSYPTEQDIKDISTYITYCKNMMFDKKAMEDKADNPQFVKIYERYESELKRRMMIDYDDQMVVAYKLLVKIPELLDTYSKQYSYICMDEAQDSSKIQHAIVNLLAGHTKSDNLFEIGDDDQSIYGFRAAFPEGLLNFKEYHKNATMLKLEENFRSNANIVAFADKFVQGNKGRIDKTMKAHRTAYSRVTALETNGSRSAQYTSLMAMARTRKNQTAVITRNNEQLIPLVDMLLAESIPFSMASREITFFTSKIVQDIRNIVAFAISPTDTVLFKQLYYKMDTRINKAIAERICKESIRTGTEPLQLLIGDTELTVAARKRIKNLKIALNSIQTSTASAAMRKIRFDIGYGDYLDRNHMDIEKVKILDVLAEKQPTIIAMFARMDELNRQIKAFEPDSACGLQLMTIHGSKGLEYDDVYLMDVRDGILPASPPFATDDYEQPEYQEERRLFYVAITRAKNNLYIYDFGMSSSFLREAFSLKSKSQRKAGTIKPKIYTYGPEDRAEFTDEIAKGGEIRHVVFGTGHITYSTMTSLKVDFNGVPKMLDITTLLNSGCILRAN